MVSGFYYVAFFAGNLFHFLKFLNIVVTLIGPFSANFKDYFGEHKVWNRKTTFKQSLWVFDVVINKMVLSTCCQHCVNVVYHVH